MSSIRSLTFFEVFLDFLTTSFKVGYVFLLGVSEETYEEAEESEL